MAKVARLGREELHESRFKVLRFLPVFSEVVREGGEDGFEVEEGRACVDGSARVHSEVVVDREVGHASEGGHLGVAADNGVLARSEGVVVEEAGVVNGEVGSPGLLLLRGSGSGTEGESSSHLGRGVEVAGAVRGEENEG